MIYDKIYLKACINNQYICLKNNTAQLYFILGRAELCFNFSHLLRDAPIIHRFQTVQRPTSYWKICTYQKYPKVHWKNLNVLELSLI